MSENTMDIKSTNIDNKRPELRPDSVEPGHENCVHKFDVCDVEDKKPPTPVDTSNMKVLKRNGQLVPFSIIKITKRIDALCWGLNRDYVIPAEIAKIVEELMYDNIPTEEIDFLTADVCANKIYRHPDFNLLAGRICISNIHKTTDSKIENVARTLFHHKRDGFATPLISHSLYTTIIENADKIQAELKFDRDYNFTFFGIKTLEKAYLTRIKSSKMKDISNQSANEHELRKRYGKIIERPQHMWMRVALGIHGNNLTKAFETYHRMSNKKMTHATPTLYNAGTDVPQLSSCFLMHMNDSLYGMYNETISSMAHISKRAGGIGVSLTDIRANGSYIRGTNGVSDGIIPLCRVLNEVSQHVNQGGRRNGSIACFVKDTDVFTVNDGIKKIQDIKVGDLVITHKNRVRPVVQTHKNPLGDRKIYKLNVAKTKDIYVTGNHKFWSCYTKKYKSKKLSLGWNSINDLKELMDNKETTRQTCYISIPTETGIVEPNTKYINVLDYSDIILNDRVKEFKTVNNMIITVTKVTDVNNRIRTNYSKPIKKVWKIDENFANLLGMWLGDGHIKKSHTNGKVLGIGFAVHSDNEEQIKLIKKLCKEIFGSEPTSFKPNERNVVHLTMMSYPIGMIFKELFGSYFNGKKLSPMVFGWPKNLINHLMAGLITTDGHITKNKNNISLGLSNETLMTQLYHLCRNNGIDVSFVKGHKSKGMTTDPYVMSIPARKDIIEHTHKLYSDDRISKCIEKERNNNDHSEDMFLKINEITETDRQDEYVYTLGVEEDHSYTVEGLIAQNCYLEPWHADVWEFCELKLKDGNEQKRARKLFYALWIPDLFMERVWNNENWSLFCPDECRGLSDAYGEEFNKLYVKYEKMGKARKTMPAVKLWLHILTSQIETGMPYMAYKDHGNNKSNQKNLGTIKCSNLCCEVFEYSGDDEIAVCNLLSICLPKCIKTDDKGNKYYDYEELLETARIATRNLNKIIDLNFYPVKETETSNKRNRPIGIGVQGFADALYIMKYPFSSQEARDLNNRIFETIYYGALLESNKLAMEEGPYPTFKESPFSEGKLQFHLWGYSEDDLLMGYDWKSLIESIKEHGTRNSLLTAIMPTASTAHIMGNIECIEAPTTNLYVRNTQTGEYIVANEHLMRDLLELGLWTDDVISEIQYDNGSIQKIDCIPDDVKELYKTAFEIKKKDMIDLCADRGKFIDQSQSFNVFNDEPDFEKLTSIHFYGWKKGLKTGMYYHRSKPASDGIKFGLDSEFVHKLKEKRKNKNGEYDPRRTNEIEDNQKTTVCRLRRGGEDYSDCDVCGA